MYRALYILPALVALSLFVGAEAAQERTETERVANIDKRIDKLNERIDEIERYIEAYRQTANEWKIPRLESKIEKLEDRIAELEGQRDPTSHFQAKIDRLQERITLFENKMAALDPATQQAKIDKIQTKIDRLNERIAALQARLGVATDTTPPTVSSVAVDMGTRVLTIVFDEPIDIDRVDLTQITTLHGNISDSAVITASDSDTLEVKLTQTHLDAIDGAVNPSLLFLNDPIFDVAGNALATVQKSIMVMLDTTPPGITGRAINTDTGIFTITFTEPIDYSEADLADVLMRIRAGPLNLSHSLSASTISNTGDDSNILTIELSPTVATNVAREGARVWISYDGDSIKDLAGNLLPNQGVRPVSLT